MINSSAPPLSPALQDQLRILRDGYAARLPEKLGQIELLWNVVSHSARASWPEDALFTLHRLVHSLAGSGATFGFPELSLHARRAEIELKSFAAGKAELDETQREIIGAALSDLNQCALVPHGDVQSGLQEVTPAPSGHRSLVLLSDDPSGIEWSSAIETFGYDLRVCTSPRAFLDATRETPAALIVNCEANPLEARIEGHAAVVTVGDIRRGRQVPSRMDSAPGRFAHAPSGRAVGRSRVFPASRGRGFFARQAR